MATRSRKSPGATQADLAALRTDIRSDLKGSNAELLRAFKVMNEQLLEDFRGAFSDRTQQQNDRLDNHQRRIVVVEDKLGIAV
jgi:hypothetical protein